MPIVKVIAIYGMGHVFYSLKQKLAFLKKKEKPQIFYFANILHLMPEALT